MLGTVHIDGKEFEVEEVYSAPISGRGFCGTCGVFIDEETLFTTKTEEVLFNGAPLRLFYGGENGCCILPQRYMKDLRRKVESDKLETAAIQMRKTFPKISNTLQSFLEAIPHLGKQQLAMSNGGYGNSEPIFCFVGIVLKKDNSLIMEVFRDEGVAARRTQEAVKFFYDKTMQSKIKKGEKKLSPEAKQEFKQEAMELAKGLEVSNFEERAAYLEELYDALIV